MGSYISIESLDIYENLKKESKIKSDTEIKSDAENKSNNKNCNCGNFSPHIQGGSCRHCYGFI